MNAHETITKDNAIQSPSCIMRISLPFDRCHRKIINTGNAKNANVNRTKIPTEQVAPMSRSDGALLDTDPFCLLFRLFTHLTATTSRNANTIASKLLVKGLTPNTRHGHDDANAITSIGGIL